MPTHLLFKRVLLFSAICYCAYITPATSKVIPVHEYGKLIQQEEYSPEICLPSYYNLTKCTGGMICRKCKAGHQSRYKLLRCKKGYTQDNDQCIKNTNN